MSHWSRRLITVLLCLPLLVAAGCLDMETGVAFNKDLTGKATFKMAMDLGPFLTQMMQTMGARGGEPPPVEMMPMLKAEMAKQLSGGMVDVDQMKAKLPAGVTLVDSSQKIDELKVMMAFTFGFTDFTKLALIEVPMISRAQAIPGAASDPLKPFDFVITNDGSTISITTKAAEKATEKPADAEKAKADALALAKEAKSQIDQLGIGEMLKGASVHMVMRFDIPHTIIEQNATRKEGQSYIWEVKLDSFDSLDKMPEPPVIKLKFKK